MTFLLIGKVQMTIKNNRGLSILEAVIAMGIVSLVSFSVVTLIGEQNKQIKQMSQKIIINDLKNTIITAMQDSATCTANLNSLLNPSLTFDSTSAIKEISVPRLRMGSSSGATILAEVGSEVISGSSLFVSSIKLEKLTDIGGGKWSGIWKITLQNSFSSFVYKPITLQPQTFDVNTTNPNGAFISACHSGGGVGGIWQVSGSNIYYPTGNVGIGTPSPNSQFSLGVGSAGSGYSTYNVTEQSGFAYTFPNTTTNNFARVLDIAAVGQISGTNGGSEIRFLTNPNNSTTAQPRLLINRDGRVGLGTTNPIVDLHIAGTTGDLFLDWAANSNDAPQVSIRRGRGSLSSPTGLIANDDLGTFNFYSHNGSSYAKTAGIVAKAYENHFGTSRGTVMLFQTTPTGTSTPVIQMILGNDGILGVQSEKGLSWGTGSSHIKATSANSTSDNLRFTANSNEVLRITGAGNVGIGTTNPNFKLDVNGDTNIAPGASLRFGGSAICTSAGCTSPSDRRLKKDITPLQAPLQKILKLQGVSYEYINKVSFINKKQIGFIAQDVESVFPEVVITDPKSGMKSIAYDHLIAPVIEAVKIQFKSIVDVEIRTLNHHQEISAIKAEIEIKNEKIKQLELKMRHLENLVNSKY